MRNPYKFPARSRAAMIAAMEAIGGRHDRYAYYPFAWNVKIHSWGDITAAGLAEFAGDHGAFNPQWDSAWRRYCDNSESLFWRVCEDAARYYLDGEYCTWPGDDQGNYEFELHGRSGGWLVLTKWRGRSLRNFHIADACAADEFAELDWSEIRDLYRAVETMNQDLTSAKVQHEFRWNLAAARAQWEESRRDAIERELAWQREAAADARELLFEFRAARACDAAIVAVPAICRTIRAAIVDRIRLARNSRRRASAMASGRLWEC